MRRLLYLAIFWACSSLLFYGYGLPWMMRMLQGKVRDQTYATCMLQLRTQGIIEAQTAPLVPEDGQQYCHCVSDPLTFTRADLFDAVHKRQPAHVAAQAQQQVAACTPQLQEKIDAATPAPSPAAPTPPSAPGTTTVEPDGTQVIHF
jgi:hypothetical protein